jgi:hypothetical protein
MFNIKCINVIVKHLILKVILRIDAISKTFVFGLSKDMFDAPPNSLKNSNVSSKVKTME